MKKWLCTADEDLQSLPDAAAQTCELAGLAGNGTVKVAELTVSRLTADAEAGDVPAVDGCLRLPAEIEVAVANAGGLSVEDVFVPCMRCGSVEGLGASSVVLSGDMSWKTAGMKAKRVFENGILGVLFRARRGTAVIVR
jgi:hypothetical protein